MKVNIKTDILWVGYGMILGAAFGHIEIGLIIGALVFTMLSYKRKKNHKS